MICYSNTNIYGVVITTTRYNSIITSYFEAHHFKMFFCHVVVIKNGVLELEIVTLVLVTTHLQLKGRDDDNVQLLYYAESFH